MKINNPLSDKQLKDGDLIPKGEYDFSVQDAIDTYSQAGNEMIKLKIRVWMPDGRERTVFDYLLEALEYKLGHFCEATGLVDRYKSGLLEALDCIGKSGRLKIAIQSDKSGQYGDRSVVVDYIPSDEEEASRAKSSLPKTAIDPNFDDSLDKIPF